MALSLYRTATQTIKTAARVIVTWARLMVPEREDVELPMSMLIPAVMLDGDDDEREDSNTKPLKM